VHVLGAVDAVEDDGVHARSLRYGAVTDIGAVGDVHEGSAASTGMQSNCKKFTRSRIPIPYGDEVPRGHVSKAVLWYPLTKAD
jgi:hypothetical protein